MTKRTDTKIQAFKVKGRQPNVDARAQVYKASTKIPAKELVEWLGRTAMRSWSALPGGRSLT